MHVELYTKSDCVYCTMTKDLLNKKKISFTENKLDEDFAREYLLERYPSARAYPIVVVDGYMIGGYDQLNTMILLEEQLIDNRKLLNEGM